MAESRGNPGHRAVQGSYAVLVLLAAVVVVLGLQTLRFQYRGSAGINTGVSTNGTAEVGDCHRVGPVSRYGFGCWWDCTATVTTDDGRSRTARTVPSVLTPADRGRLVRVAVSCAATDDPCRVTGPSPFLLGLAAFLLQILSALILGLGLLLTGTWFLYALLGLRLATAIFTRRPPRTTDAEIAALREVRDALTTVATAGDQGVLRLVAIRPEWVLEHAYAPGALPVFAFEGVDRELIGWDTVDVPVRAGAVRVVAWLPRADGRSPRRISQLSLVGAGKTAGLAFRPSPVPDIGGLLTPIDDEVDGPISLLRLTVAVGLLTAAISGAFRLLL